MTEHPDLDPSALGPNMWLIDEMYRRYRDDPGSVNKAWKEFFEDFRPRLESSNGDSVGAPSPITASGTAPTKAVPSATSPGGGLATDGDERVAVAPEEEEKAAAPAPGSTGKTAPEGAERIRFGAERIVKNMERSLAMPTATSFRFVPAKLLEENRRVINRFLAANRGGKVSFTHLIGWAVVRALEAIPAMKSHFEAVDGVPHVVRPDTVNLGLAVDVEKEGGSRNLLVPNVKDASEMDFAAFWAAYEEIIRKVRANKLTPDDFARTTATLTNPGTIGTQLSVPRLMSGQGVIVATGRIDYPTEYQGADPATLASIGVGKVVGVTSTYDHRVIQGAESGLFLAKIEELLVGGDGFYEEVFASLGIPYEPVRWSKDRRGEVGREPAEAFVEKEGQVLRLVNMYRVRGHLLAKLDPLGGGKVLSHPELDPAFHGLSVWDLDREFLVDDLPGDERERPLRGILDLLRDSYCHTVGIEYMHIQEPDQ
jgi:2-oxoglutarate decarboxylase